MSNSTSTFDQLLSEPPTVCYVLQLYIAGLTPRSTLAIERIRTICDRFLPGRFELTIIDLYLNPEEAMRAQVIVVPTLIKRHPSPMRLFVGDLTDDRMILRCLNIEI